MISINLMRGAKVCTECHSLKALAGFSPVKIGRQGRASKCHPCRAQRYDRTEKSRAAKARYMRERRASDPAFAARQKETAKAPHRRYARRDYQVLRQYGLGPEDLARLYVAQGRKCGGCARAIDLGKLTSIDHCHVTGAVRGLLCVGCNIALGLANDSPETLRGLVKYLAAHDRRATCR